jgi:hypothetical protein
VSHATTQLPGNPLNPTESPYLRRATSAKAKSSSISKADSVNLPLVSGVTNAWSKPPWQQLKKIKKREALHDVSV